MKWRNFALLWGIYDGVQTPGKNEVTKAALVSLVLMGGFSVCAVFDRKSSSKNWSRFIAF
ncbi:MAG: hypothetical protein ABSA06_06940 [Geobacteraceae bacterium]